MSSKLAALQSDYVTWRLIGVATWHSAVTVSVYVGLCGLHRTGILPCSAPTLSASILLYCFNLLVLYCQSLLISTTEPGPLLLPNIPGRSWISVLLSRTVLRSRQWSDAVPLAAYYASLIASAVCQLLCTRWQPHQYSSITEGSSSSSGLRFTWCLRTGLFLGLVHAIRHLSRGCEVLAYPPIHRHRYFRLKRSWLPALRQALQESIAAVVMALLTHSSSSGVDSLQGLCASVLACTIASFGWSMGSALLLIVYSEPLQLQLGPVKEEGACNADLISGMGNSSLIVQDLTLQDLAAAASSVSTAATLRRAALFADESGRAAWLPIIQCLVGEVRDLTVALGAAMQSPALVAGLGAGNGGSKWNGLSRAAVASTVTALGSVLHTPGRQQQLVDNAVWALRGRCQRVRWAMQVLSGLVVAGQQGEDRFGVLLLCDPNLSDMLAACVSLSLVLQQFVKTRVSSRPRSSQGFIRSALQPLLQLPLVSSLCSSLGSTGPNTSAAAMSVPGRDGFSAMDLPIERVAFILESEARRCVSGMCLAYSSKAPALLEKCSVKPAWGSMMEVTTFLTAVISQAE